MESKFKIGDIVKVSTWTDIKISNRIARIKDITPSRLPEQYPNSKTYHLMWLDDKCDVNIRDDFLWPVCDSDKIEHVENALQRLKRRYEIPN